MNDKSPAPVINLNEACSHNSIYKIGVYHSCREIRYLFGWRIDTLLLMNYMSTTHIIGESKLRLLYSDEDLNSLISEFIAGSNEFTFSQLCCHILSTAEQNGKLEKAPHTTYSSISLTTSDYLKITRMIWERIWSKEIYMLFSSLNDKYRRSDETYFIVDK